MSSNDFEVTTETQQSHHCHGHWNQPRKLDDENHGLSKKFCNVIFFFFALRWGWNLVMSLWKARETKNKTERMDEYSQTMPMGKVNEKVKNKKSNRKKEREREKEKKQNTTNKLWKDSI